MSLETLARRIAASPVEPREPLLELLGELRERSPATALKALFRQQVGCGFVLCDPAGGLEERRLPDPELGLEFVLQWNPRRELRKDHALLRERGIIASVPLTKLVHVDARGLPCPLCEHNMRLQNPSELLLPFEVAGERFHVGANFAPIGDHHFTVVSAEHRPQAYHPRILRAGLELAAATDGEFRVIFNGRAGASVPQHEHLQAMTTVLPIERLQADAARTVEHDGARLWQAHYPVPLWIVESSKAEPAIAAADRLLRAWHRLDPHNHVENLLMSAEAGRPRIYLLLRDRRRLGPPGLHGHFGCCESAGLLVFSHAAAPGSPRPDERQLFERADLSWLRRQYQAVAPERALRLEDL